MLAGVLNSSHQAEKPLSRPHKTRLRIPFKFSDALFHVSFMQDIVCTLKHYVFALGQQERVIMRGCRSSRSPMFMVNILNWVLAHDFSSVVLGFIIHHDDFNGLIRLV